MFSFRNNLFGKCLLSSSNLDNKPKKKSAWWIWALLALVLAIPLVLTVWTTVDPSVLDSYNKEKTTQMNFNRALVHDAQVWASQAPVLGSVVFLRADGHLDSRNLFIYGYNVKADMGKCASFFYENDDQKLIKMRQICVYPEKVVKVETPWYGNIVKAVSNWKVWEKYGKLYNELGAFGSP